MSDSLGLLDNIDQLAPKRIGIQEFVESDQYAGIALYPRQTVLLKLLFLEEMTGKEEDVLTEWINGGRNGSEIVISPNIRERRQYLRDNNYKHFREIQFAVGRRASKGFTTGASMAYSLWNTLQLGNPGEYYGIDRKKEIYFSCIAGSESQAKKFQYADMVARIESNKAFQPYIADSLETEIRIMTPADIREISSSKARGQTFRKDQARLRGNALAANAGTLRGSATMALVIDEAAHMIAGESKSSAQEVYNAAGPSLDQFAKDGMMFINSSPYSKVGMFHDLYQLGLMPFDPTRPVDLTTVEFTGDDGELVEQGINGDPRRMVFQGPSWALFQGYRYYTSKYKPRERGKMLGKMVTVSPDWNPEDVDEQGRPLFSEEDKAAIIQARASEAADPETYKVERRGKFAEISEAWLNPSMVDRMYHGRPIGLVPQSNGDMVMGYEPLYTNYGVGINTGAFRYKFHLDPSSTTAGFGFAIGHIEYLPDPVTGVEVEHCVDDKTEILTVDGWKFLKNVKLGELVATRSSDNNLVYQPIKKIINYKYDGELYTYNSKNLNFAVTPEHRMLVAKRSNSQYKYYKIKNLDNKWYVPKTVNKTTYSDPDKFFSLPEYPLIPSLSVPQEPYQRTPESIRTIANRHGLKRNHPTSINLPNKLPPTKLSSFAKFVGIWLAEGCKIKRIEQHGYTTGWCVYIYQKKPEGVNWIDSLFKELNWPFEKILNKNGSFVWKVHSYELSQYLLNLQDGENLHLPTDCYNWPIEAMDGLLEGLMAGDGSGFFYKKTPRSYAYHSSSISLLDDIQKLLLPMGYSGMIKRNYCDSSQLVDRAKCKPMWLIRINRNCKNSILDVNKIKKIQYNGNVYCVSVDNSNFYMRREGIPSWTGNCVFDLIKRWNPAKQPGKVIRWKPIIDEIITLAKIFHPFEITMDQHQCLAENTLIPTIHGNKTLKDLAGNLEVGQVKNINIPVQTIDGIANAIEIYNRGKVPTRILTTKPGYNIEGTTDHRLWVRKDKTKPWNKPNKWEWLTIAEIQKGDYVAVRKNNISANKYINLKLYHPKGTGSSKYVGVSYNRETLQHWIANVSQNNQQITLGRYDTEEQAASAVLNWKKQYSARKGVYYPDKLNEDIGFMLGALAAEGSVTSINASFGNSDKSYLDMYKDCAERTFGGDWSYSYLLRENTTPQGGKVETMYGNIAAAGYISKMFDSLGASGNSYTKKVPWAIFQSPESVIINFLKAYFEGDGCVINSRSNDEIVMCNTRSEELAKGLQQLLLNLGIYSTLWHGHASDYKGTKQKEWRVKMFGLDILEFERKIGFCSERKNKKLSQVVDQINNRKDVGKRSKLNRVGNLQYFRITEIKESIANCYDLSVPGPELFVANGIISHNSSSPLQEIQDRLNQENISCQVYMRPSPQPLDARLLTPSGWINMGDVKVGDYVYGSDGKAHAVSKIVPAGKRPIYRVHMVDGGFTECTEDHTWTVRSRSKRGKIHELTLNELIQKGIRYDSGLTKWQVPLADPLEFWQDEELPIDPYLMGSLLGDGCFNKSVSMACHIDDYKEQKAIFETMIPNGMTIEVRDTPGNWKILYFKKQQGTYINPLSQAIRDLQLWYVKRVDKFIPDIYMKASIDDRIALLQGLIDTDGNIRKEKHGVRFANISATLAQQVVDLVGSLGGIANIKSWKNTRTLNVSIMRLPSEVIPCRLQRKVDLYRPIQRGGRYRYISHVEYVGEKEAQCIGVDNDDHLYITDNYILTHNTAELNWKKCEVFKTALYQGLVHAPQDEEIDGYTSKEELKFLQQVQTSGKYPRVDKQDLGPVQTKDMCLHPSHEVLTIQGWKPIADITLQDQVASRTPSGEIKYNYPTKIHQKNIKELIYVYEEQNIDFACTHDHHLLILNDEGLQIKIKAEDIKYKELIPKLSFTTNKSSEYFDIVDKMKYKIHQLESLSVPEGYCQCGCGGKPADRPTPLPICKTKDFAAFVGFWLGDGIKIKKSKTYNTGYKVTLNQTKPEGQLWIENLLDRLKWPYQINFNKTEKRYEIFSYELREYLYNLQDGHDLHLPQEAFVDWSIDVLEGLMDGLLASDGTFDVNASSRSFTNSSYTLMEDIQRICLHMNRRASKIYKRSDPGHEIIIKGKKTYARRAQYQLTVSDRRPHAVLFKKNIKYIDYDGPVYCLTTDTGNFLTRRNGVVNWIGNCDAIIDVVWALMGNLQLQTMRERLAHSSVVGGSPGGYGMGRRNYPSGAPMPMNGDGNYYYSQRNLENARAGKAPGSPTRGAIGMRRQGGGSRISTRGRH